MPVEEDVLRIPDVPERELQPINPLAQHLPFPMNVNAPQQASPHQDYLTFDFHPAEGHRRRATLPSVLQLAAAETPPAESLDADSPDIGIALSSPQPIPRSSIQSKRRSRSVSAMRDLAQERHSIERRRSAEIRYWRDSQQSGIVHSIAPPRPQTSHTTVQTVRVVDNHMDGSTRIELAEVTISSSSASIHSGADDLQGVRPAAAIHTADSEDVNPGPEVESQYSDQVVSKPSEKRLSIEERVRHLEDNMQVLEASVRRISGRTNRQTIILEGAPKGRRSRNASSSPKNDLAESDDTILGSASNIGPTCADSDLPNGTYLDDCAQSKDAQRTILGLDLDRILPSSAGEDSDLARQLAVITDALQNEHQARKTLETHVDRLQREVSNLRVVVEKLLSSSPSYPTPSPDTIIMSSEERLSTPRARAHSARDFGHDSDDDIPNTVRRMRETIISRFSQSDSEADSCSMASNITSPEAWATPKEHSAFGSGFFSTNRSKEVF